MPVLPTINNTLGAAFIGFAVSCAAFGVCTNQAITYFARYPEDRVGYKLLVVFVWALTLADQALIGHVLFFYTIENYANPIILLEKVTWTLIAQILLGAAIGTIVRLCFAMRVWRFSQQNITVTAAIVLLTFAEIGIAIAYVVKCFENPFLTILPNLKVMASLALGVGALCDAAIALALCFFLRRFRTGSKRADSLVTNLTVYAVNTGSVTAAISIATLVLYDLEPNTFRFLACYFILCKLYTISFFCTLNTRRIIRGKGTDRSDGRSDGHTGTGGLSGESKRIPKSNNTFQPRLTTTKGTTATGLTGTSAGISYGPGFGLTHMQGYPQGPPTGGFTLQALEIGVHQETSITSDVDGEDFKQHPDDVEMSISPASTRSPSSPFGPARPYAYAPPTTPAYVHAARTDTDNYVYAYAR